MPISINGNTGVVTGLAVGGLPDGTVDTDMLAANAVSNAKIADLFSGGATGGITIAGIRIQTGSVTTAISTVSASTSYGVSTQKYIDTTVTGLTGFNSAPAIFVTIQADYHDAAVAGCHNISTSGFQFVVVGSRDGAITNRTCKYVAIGEAS